MPRGKEYCAYENDFFTIGTFEVVDGTKIHRVDPLHRVTDGAMIKIVNGKVIELQKPPEPPAMDPPP